MKFGKWIGLVLVGVGCAAVAQGQVAAYVGYGAAELTGIACLSATVPCANGTQAVSSGSTAFTGPAKPSGFLVGGYWGFRNVGPVRLGVDVRYMDFHSNKSAVTSAGGKDASTTNTVLAGLRGSVHTPISWLKPYAQISFGRTGSDATEPSCQTTGGPVLLCSGSGTSATPRQTDSFLQYEAFAGADIRILPVLDLRAIELGIGNMNRYGNGTAGTTSSVGVRSIGFGIVLHTPSR